MKKTLTIVFLMSFIGLASSPTSACFCNWWSWITDWFSGSSDGYTVKEIISQEHILNKDGRVSVTALDGSVTIEGWDYQSIKVEAIKRGKSQVDLDNLDVIMNLEDNKAAIKTIAKFTNTIKASIDYIIKVPSSAQLQEIRSANGAIIIRDVQGVIDAFTANGAVTIEGATDRVAARTDNGVIRINGTAKPVKVETANGHIEITDANGSIDALTNNGSITVGQKMFPSDAHISLTSNMGSITLRLPKNVGAQIYTDTKMGSVRSDFAIQKGIIGTGGGKIELATQMGSITIKKD